MEEVTDGNEVMPSTMDSAKVSTPVEIKSHFKFGPNLEMPFVLMENIQVSRTREEKHFAPPLHLPAIHLNRLILIDLHIAPAAADGVCQNLFVLSVHKLVVLGPHDCDREARLERKDCVS